MFLNKMESRNKLLTKAHKILMVSALKQMNSETFQETWLNN